jgi:hypothetical protein
MTLYLMQCHSFWGDNTVQLWEAGLGTAKPDKLLSIGQHYGLRTHLMDWTSDWEVAMWFATHQWNSGGYEQGGDGVIYQLGISELILAENTANAALGLKSATEVCRHVDIRDTPAPLAPRAFAQRGFSIANVESPCFLQELINQKAITVNVFPRAVTACGLNALTKSQLVPPADEMYTLFESARTDKVLFQNALNWIQAHYPHLMPTISDIGYIFA